MGGRVNIPRAGPIPADGGETFREPFLVPVPRAKCTRGGSGVESTTENRKNPRYPIPLVEMIVVIPALSDTPLVPEDVSAGGFRVVVAREPEPGVEYDLTLWVGDAAFEGFKASAIRVREAEGEPGRWDAGLGLIVPDTERARFAAALESLTGGGAGGVTAQRSARPGECENAERVFLETDRAVHPARHRGPDDPSFLLEIGAGGGDFSFEIEIAGWRGRFFV